MKDLKVSINSISNTITVDTSTASAQNGGSYTFTAHGMLPNGQETTFDFDVEVGCISFVLTVPAHSTSFAVSLGTNLDGYEIPVFSNS